MTGLKEKSRKDSKLSGKTRLIISVAVAAAVVLLVMIGLASGLKKANETIDQLADELNQERKIDVTYVGNKLETVSELAAAEMTYNGVIYFEDGSIPLINKKEFYMFYRATVKAGIDLSQAEVMVTENAVTINLPEVEIYEPNVDEKSIQFFDQSFSLFNQEKMTDLAEAITEAKEDLLTQPETENMKQTAKDHVVVLLNGLLAGQIGERDLVINVG